MSSPEYFDPLAAIEWGRKRRAETPRDVVPADGPRELPPVILDGGAEHVWTEYGEDADGNPGMIEHRGSLLANRDDEE